MLESKTNRDLPATDGRFRRSQRSKEAIVNALLELVGEGVVEPTADQVAERASIGIRTVFRHFNDMETLYAAMDDILVAQHLPRFAQSVPKCSLEERVSEFVARRSKFYESIAPYRRAANIKRPHSGVLQERHASTVRRLAQDLLRWFPELEKERSARRNAVELVTSLEAWERLRLDQRLGKARAAEAMEEALRALLRVRR